MRQVSELAAPGSRVCFDALHRDHMDGRVHNRGFSCGLEVRLDAPNLSTCLQRMQCINAPPVMKLMTYSQTFRFPGGWPVIQPSALSILVYALGVTRGVSGTCHCPCKTARPCNLPEQRCGFVLQ